MPDSKTAPVVRGREIVRFGLPMALDQLTSVLAVFDTPEGTTVRHFNGCLIVEAPAADA